MTGTSEPPVIVKVAGKEIDIRGFAPVTLGDLEDLEEAGLLSKGGELNVQGMKPSIEFLHIVLRKCDPEITREQVRAIDSNALSSALSAAGGMLGERQEPDAERPTEPPGES